MAGIKVSNTVEMTITLNADEIVLIDKALGALYQFGNSEDMDPARDLRIDIQCALED